MNKPLISIITATLNSGTSLEKTILSVLNQSYENVEHIIIDGGSKDNTLEILEKYKNNYKVRWISEPDKGISDAFNKGLRIAKGEYINFQGAGDCFSDNDAIENIQVVMLYDTTKTDEDGLYQISDNEREPGDQTYFIQFQDIDNVDNGEFENLDTIVEFIDPEFTDGDGGYYAGETEIEFNVKLNPKE